MYLQYFIRVANVSYINLKIIYLCVGFRMSPTSTVKEALPFHQIGFELSSNRFKSTLPRFISQIFSRDLVPVFPSVGNNSVTGFKRKIDVVTQLRWKSMRYLLIQIIMRTLDLLIYCMQFCLCIIVL